MFNHPAHPMLVHLPVGLWSSCALWDLLHLITGNLSWWTISYWSLALGLAAGAIASVAGFIDYFRIPADHPGNKSALFHIGFILTAFIFYGLSFWLRDPAQAPQGMTLFAGLALSYGGFILLAVGGWFGGEIVYKHGAFTPKQKDNRA